MVSEVRQVTTVDESWDSGLGKACHLASSASCARSASAEGLVRQLRLFTLRFAPSSLTVAECIALVSMSAIHLSPAAMGCIILHKWQPGSSTSSCGGRFRRLLAALALPIVAHAAKELSLELALALYGACWTQVTECTACASSATILVVEESTRSTKTLVVTCGSN